LGAVIEIVSGEKLDDFFYKHIFEPLGMTDTYFYLPQEKADRLVKVYEYNKDQTGFIIASYEDTEYPVEGAKTYLSGGADLSSTAYDIGIFAQMLLNKGVYNGIRIVGSRYVEMMAMQQTEHDWWNCYVGFALTVTNKAGAIQGPLSDGSYTWGGFFDTQCWVDPNHDFVAILLLQMYPNNEFRIHEKFQSITYGIIDDL